MKILLKKFFPVRFVQFLEGEDVSSYLESKWSPSTEDPVTLFDLITLSMDLEPAKSLKTQKTGLLADLTEDQKKVFSTLVDQVIPNAADESLTKEDSLEIVAHDPVYTPGTVVLRRTTNKAEFFFFFPEMQIQEGTLYRFLLEDDSLEGILKGIQFSQLYSDLPAVEIDENSLAEITAADPITLSLLAGKALIALVEGIASTIGSKAVEWAIKQLGIEDLIGEAQLTYEQLVEALRVQERENFKKNIRIQLSAFHTALRNFNNGMRTEKDLFRLYDRAIDLVSWAKEDEREVDRVHVLAYTQTCYLSIMQERAEWYRGKDEKKLKLFYEAMVKAAADEAEALEKIANEAIKKRMDRISGLKRKFDGAPFVGPWICYYDEVPEDAKDNWTRYYARCIRRDRNLKCVEWDHNTTSAIDARNEMRRRKTVHYNLIRGRVNHAMRGVWDVVKKFREISKRESPFPAPKNSE